METSTGSDKSLSYMNKEADRQKAIKVLEKAKSIKRKVIFLPRGASGSLHL